ncbi:unnamed protein product [Ilex paraguariensis]|uniref:Uncharacterized protein n=1 Tax=Ilex paraguariensis TaxID=185542 RepID=A0ABC8RIJ9_9AQUA
MLVVFCIDTGDLGLTPDEIIRVCNLSQIEGVKEDIATPSKKRRKRTQKSPLSPPSNPLTSKERFTVAELEMSFTLAMLRGQFFEVENERDEMREENARLKEEIKALKIRNLGS